MIVVRLVVGPSDIERAAEDAESVGFEELAERFRAAARRARELEDDD